MAAIGRFWVGTLNAETLCHSGQRLRQAPTWPGYDRGSYGAKVAWLAHMLDDGPLDVLGLQECHSRRALDDVLHASKLRGAEVFAPGLDGEVLCGSDGTELVGGPHNALVTRVEMVDAEAIVEFPVSVCAGVCELPDGDPAHLRRFDRPMLRATLRLPGGGGVTVFVAHLHSRRGRFDDGVDRSHPVGVALAAARAHVVRTAEAVALRALVVEQLETSELPVIVLGCFNDTLWSTTTQLVAGPLAARLGDIEAGERLLHSANELDDGGDCDPDEYSHVFDGRAQLLDHVLVSEQLQRRNPNRIGRVRNVRVLNQHLLDAGHSVASTPPPSVRTDHALVAAQISFD